MNNISVTPGRTVKKTINIMRVCRRGKRSGAKNIAERIAIKECNYQNHFIFVIAPRTPAVNYKILSVRHDDFYMVLMNDILEDYIYDVQGSNKTLILD